MAMLKCSVTVLLSSSHIRAFGGPSGRLPLLPIELVQRTINPEYSYGLAAFPALIRRSRNKGRDSWVTPFCTIPKTSTSAPPIQDNEKNIKEAADLLDFRVGRILKAWKHEEADSLYIEEVDVGEPHPRVICSGLVNFIPLDQLEDKKVVVLANLKPRNMRGVKSCGMLMAASDASHQNVELLEPPANSIAGERIWFGSEHERENQSAAATANQIQKKKIWELVQPHLKTDASCVAMLGLHVMRTSAGIVACRSLKNANIS